MLRHWGVTKLGAYEYSESLDEMKHADKLIERIPFLDGLPNLQDLDKLLIGESVRDFVTRDRFSEILEAEEDHVDFIESQLELIPKIGIENYIQLPSGHAE